MKPLNQQSQEEAICPNEACGSGIQKSHVFKNVDITGLGETRRTVKIFCRHCDQAYKVIQVLRGGVWQDEAPGVQLLSGRDRTGVLKRVELADGNVQLQSLSA
jgi:hypothetical protein